MARCKPFDGQIREALTALGFEIDDDGKGAKISDEITIEIWQPDSSVIDATTFWLTIDLPNGTELFCLAKSRDLMDAAGIEADEPTGTSE